jgi:assimilatory nitrate reductase catalytic subunit
VLLSGKTTDGAAGEGPIVCACFGVGRNSIAAVLDSGEACSAAEIGVKLRAGTNCGSCLPELKRMVAAHLAATPVQVAQELSPAK